VLVADSDDGARRPLARYLDHFGFELEEVTSGPAAATALDRCRPHVVVAESTLPHDDEFQALLRTRHIPYIVTVTFDMDEVPADAAAVLVKPFPLAALLTAVRHALSAKPQPR